MGALKHHRVQGGGFYVTLICIPSSQADIFFISLMPGFSGHLHGCTHRLWGALSGEETEIRRSCGVFNPFADNLVGPAPQKGES